MRIDVAFDHRDVDAELARLHERMNSPGDALHGIATIPTALPGLVFRYREVAGEFYLYVQDVERGGLAGYSVFNRACELDRTAERYVRSPHTRIAPAYQRRGIATAVYEWALQAGLCLVSGPRQSVGAHRLWQALGTRHELVFVRVRDKKLECLGAELPHDCMEAFETRMLLLGGGWELERFARVTRCALPAPLHAHARMRQGAAWRGMARRHAASTDLMAGLRITGCLPTTAAATTRRCVDAQVHLAPIGHSTASAPRRSGYFCAMTAQARRGPALPVGCVV